jgi:hypothetical protein
MPVLHNIKHERLVNHVAASMTPSEAYKAAGFRGKDAAKLSSEILNRPEVGARLKELTARIEKRSTKKAVAKLSLSKELVLAELWDNAQLGRGVKGGSSARNRALELIGKHLGMFEEDGNKPFNPEDLTAEQIRKYLGDKAPPPPEALQ